MDSDAYDIRIIIEININYIPLFIYLSYIHSSIQNNNHYHGIYRNRVEMFIVCSLKAILTYKYWVFQIENL